MPNDKLKPCPSFYKGSLDFAKRIARVMLKLKSSHCYFIVQQAYNSEAYSWEDYEDMFKIILKENRSPAPADCVSLAKIRDLLYDKLTNNSGQFEYLTRDGVHELWRGLRTLICTPQTADCVKREKVEEAVRPKVICLCGSTRFVCEMAIISWEFEKAGNICLGLHLLPDAYWQNKPPVADHLAEHENVKEQMDELHKRKIDISDEIFVVNIGGYIGESTRSEIDYAIAHNKKVKYLENKSFRG